MALDIRSIEAVKTELVRLQVEGEQKAKMISSLVAEKNALLNDKQTLEERLEKAETSLESVHSEALIYQRQRDGITAESQRLQKELSSAVSLATSREKEFADLRGKYEELLDQGNADRVMVGELTRLRLENEFQRNELVVRDRVAQQVSLDLERLRADSSRDRLERDSLEKQLAAERARRSELEHELAVSRGRSEFNATDLSEYLNEAIDTFNGQTNSADSTMNYIISEMEVNLKAGIGTVAGAGLTMIAPMQSQLNEQGLSSFKFTIRAVPNVVESN